MLQISTRVRALVLTLAFGPLEKFIDSCAAIFLIIQTVSLFDKRWSVNMLISSFF